MEIGELKKVLDELFRPEDIIDELSPEVYWIDSTVSYGISLIDSKVYIFFEKGIPNRYIARLNKDNVKDNLLKFPDYFPIIKSIYFTLLRVGREYIQGFSINKFPIVNVDVKGQCYASVHGCNGDVVVNLEISTTESNKYNLKISRRFRRDIQSLDEAYRIISYALSDGFNYDLDFHNLDLDIIEEISYECDNLSDIDWVNIMDYEDQSFLISRF